MFVKWLLHLDEGIRAYVSDENISELKRYDFQKVAELKIYFIKVLELIKFVVWSEFIFIRIGKYQNFYNPADIRTCEIKRQNMIPIKTKPIKIDKMNYSPWFHQSLREHFITAWSCFWCIPPATSALKYLEFSPFLS